MDNFFSLFRRYLNDKAKGNAVYVSRPDCRLKIASWLTCALAVP